MLTPHLTSCFFSEEIATINYMHFYYYIYSRRLQLMSLKLDFKPRIVDFFVCLAGFILFYTYIPDFNLYWQIFWKII